MARRSGMTVDATSFVRRLSDIGKIVRHNGNRGLWDVAQEIAQGAKDRAPEKTGDLVDSIRVDPPTPPSVPTGKGYTVTISVGPVYNDAGVDYVPFMHEGIDGEKYDLGKISEQKNKGQPHKGTGVGWKFLERAFESAYRKALRKIKQRMKGSF